MDYVYEIVPEEGLIIETVTGEITVEEMAQKTEKVFSDPKFEPTFNGLLDLRGATSKMTKVELYGFVDFLERTGKFGESRWAVLASDPIVVALTQVFQNRLRNPDAVGVFGSPGAAAGFLGTRALEGRVAP